jgi:predicted acetyltransferase
MSSTSTPQIRAVRTEELPAYLDALSSSFLERIDVDRLATEVAPRWDLDRSLGAFEADRPVATYRSFDTEITVPGRARLPASAVTIVSVLPTHRRRGILRAMIAADHAAARERGDTMSLLYSAEYPIYGRFGYGVSTATATWTLDTPYATFTRRPPGTVELVRPDEALATTLAEIFERWRASNISEIRRREYRWRYDIGLAESAWGGRWKGFVAVYRNASGRADGYVRYTAEGKWDKGQPRGIVTVNELIALDDDAYVGLWQFLADIDWAATVKAETRAATERLPWYLTNARAARPSDVVDGLWVRLFDVPRALSTRTYEREGRLVLEVIDGELAEGRMRVEVDAVGGGATCRATDASPDLTLDIGALGAAYLGGTRLADAVLVRGHDEHRAGALLEADALFRTAAAPWCATFF